MSKSHGTRNSAVELVKVIAIILIIISHSIPVYGQGDYFVDTTHSTTDMQLFLIMWIRHFGQLGNVIFVVASAWFLADSKRSKMDKVFAMLFDTFVVSVIYLVPFVLFTDYPINGTVIKENLVAVLYEKSWFVTCYILLYLIHPALNAVGEAIKGKKVSTFVFTALFVYMLIMCYRGNFLYNNRLVSFVCLYLFVWYVKNYRADLCDNLKLNVILLVCSIIALPTCLLLINVVGLKIDRFSNDIQRYNNLINPVFITMGLSAINVARRCTFHSKFINYLSSMSLLVYLITENDMLKQYVKPSLFDYIYQTYTYSNIVAWCMLIAVVTIPVGFLVSALYKETIQRFTSFLATKCTSLLAKPYRKIEKKLFNHE